MRMQNFRTTATLLILLFTVFIAEIGYCLTYYVKNGGDDSSDGLTIKTAWKTIRKVNQFKFKNGDVVLFKRGDTFNDTTLKSPKVNNFTFADYGHTQDPLPIFDGNHIQPVYIKDTIKNLTIKNINISGQNWQFKKSSNLQIKSVKGIKIEGVIGNGHWGGTASEGKTAITITECTGNIVVKNCNLYNWGPKKLPKASKDFMGIAFINIFSGSISVHNNIIHDVNADCLYFENCTPKIANVYNNKLYNAGENAIDCKGIHNVNIHGNDIYREEHFTRWGGNLGTSHQPLIVVHYVPKTALKGHTHGLACDNVRIFQNTFHDLIYGVGIRLAGHAADHVENIKIYRNEFKRIGGCIHIRNCVSNVDIYSNVLMDPIRFMSPFGDIGGIHTNNKGKNIRIFNNTIYSLNGTIETGINLQATGTGTQVKNNVVYIDQSKPKEYLLRCTGWPNIPDINHNCWYNKSGEKIIKFKGEQYSASMFYAWKIPRKGESCQNPTLTSTGSLTPDSPCIDRGTDMGLIQDFLGNTVPQGDGFDIGAFEYSK